MSLGGTEWLAHFSERTNVLVRAERLTHASNKDDL